jgi:hypothetical protein
MVGSTLPSIKNSVAVGVIPPVTLEKNISPLGLFDSKDFHRNF